MPSIRVLFNQQEILQQGLEKEIYTIGRQEGCDIHIDNLGISRVHARLVREGGIYRVEDMNSSNGTWVNGKQVQKHNLNPGDEITIGKFSLQYQGEAQASNLSTVPEAPSADKPIAGDIFGTLQMDGEAIRKRIEDMHKGKATAEATPAATAAPVAELKAREAELEMLRSNLKTQRLLIGLLALVVLAAAGAAVLFLLR